MPSLRAFNRFLKKMQELTKGTEARGCQQQGDHSEAPSATSPPQLLSPELTTVCKPGAR